MSIIKSEFSDQAPIPRAGLTSIEAERFLRMDLPDVPHWLCWQPGGFRASAGLSRIPVCRETEGHFRGWSWKRVQVGYPCISYSIESIHCPQPEIKWTGAIRVDGASGQHFILFSYLNSMGSVGEVYFASTHDVALLNRFANDTCEEFKTDVDLLHITVVNGDDILLDPNGTEQVCLPFELRADIESQVDMFFSRPELFDGYRIPRRRGFLFVGPPGNGKTLLTRELLRRCWNKFKAGATTLIADKHVDETILSIAFETASRKGPGILVLEDLDSLTNDCDLTRAGFLAMLDGLRPKEHVLILASTNNPEKIDPALMHRPSRFDRVWHFQPPAVDLRREYIQKTFVGMENSLMDRIARKTEDWSFAYLNELRTTAAILSFHDGENDMTAVWVEKALELLATQFKDGQKGHAGGSGLGNVGFKIP